MQLKGLAPRTVEAYVCMIRLLAQWAEEDPAALGEERVRDYFLHLVRVRSYAPQTLRQARAALRCFFIEMLGVRGWRVFDHIKTKDHQQLPVVLSRDEVRRVLSQVKELRFLAPLSLIYLCGLRLNEALHIETRDIHRQELRLHVRLGKGGKDYTCRCRRRRWTCWSAGIAAIVMRACCFRPWAMPGRRPFAMIPPRRRLCKRRAGNSRRIR